MNSNNIIVVGTSSSVLKEKGGNKIIALIEFIGARDRSYIVVMKSI